MERALLTGHRVNTGTWNSGPCSRAGSLLARQDGPLPLDSLSRAWGGPLSVTEPSRGVASFCPLLLASMLGLAGIPERTGPYEPKRRALTHWSWNLWPPGLRRQHELIREAALGG